MKRYSKLDSGDFYMQNGLLVFTEQYHLKRGYCCKNNCKHCPYKKNNAAFESSELQTAPPYDVEGFMPSKKTED